MSTRQKSQRTEQVVLQSNKNGFSVSSGSPKESQKKPERVMFKRGNKVRRESSASESSLKSGDIPGVEPYSAAVHTDVPQSGIKSHRSKSSYNKSGTPLTSSR